jgi:hypothetical protein
MDITGGFDMDTCARIAQLAEQLAADGLTRTELMLLFILRLFSGCF